jgi:hypothetical protein
MDEKFAFDVSEEGEEEEDGRKVNLQQHLCLHWRLSTLRKIHNTVY